jgi:hypothetical protein
VSLGLFHWMLIVAMLAWLPVLLFQLARLVALRLWFGPLKRELWPEVGDGLTG